VLSKENFLLNKVFGRLLRILSNLDQYIHDRSFLILSLMVITPLGFYSKFYHGPLQNWVNNSLGGLFYEIFWCLLLALIIRKLTAARIATVVLVCTCVLEFLQLWHPPFLECTRANFFGRTVLGNSFAWWDFPYYFAGSGIGYLWLRRFERNSR
jgi:hypothetical protein